MPHPIDKRTREGLYNRAHGRIGSFVLYQGKRCQIMARYYRRSDGTINYDLRQEDPTGRGNYTFHKKVSHAEISYDPREGIE